MKEKHLCLRCDHNWKGGQNPDKCPKCGSSYWDTPAKRPGGWSHKSKP